MYYLAYDIALKMVEIDPLNTMSYIMQGSFFLDRNIKDGLPYFEKAYNMDPTSLITQWMLATAYCWCGKFIEAYPLIDSVEQIAPDWAYVRQILFLKYGLQGNKEKALEYATKELEAEAKDDRHFAFHLAECYAVIDEKEKALDLLEYAMQLFYPYQFLSSDPLLKNIAKEERFKNLMLEAKEKSAKFEL